MSSNPIQRGQLNPTLDPAPVTRVTPRGRGAGTPGPMDPLWVKIGQDHGCGPVLVAAVVFAMFYGAGGISKGRAPGWDAAAWAAWAGVDAALVQGLASDILAACAQVSTPKDRTAAERMRRYRARKKQAETVTDGVTHTPGKRNADRNERNANRNASRNTVTPNRNVPPQNRNASRNERNENRNGKGGGLGGGMGSSSFTGLSVLTTTSSIIVDDDAREECDFFKALKSAGAIRHAIHIHQARGKIAGWKGQGVTLAQVQSAIALAQQARIAAGSAQPLNPGYVDAVLASMLAEATRTSSSTVAPTAPPETPESLRQRAQRAIEVQLAGFADWVRRQVEFGQLPADQAASTIQAERERLEHTVPAEVLP